MPRQKRLADNRRARRRARGARHGGGRRVARDGVVEERHGGPRGGAREQRHLLQPPGWRERKLERKQWAIEIQGVGWERGGEAFQRTVRDATLRPSVWRAAGPGTARRPRSPPRRGCETPASAGTTRRRLGRRRACRGTPTCEQATRLVTRALLRQATRMQSARSTCAGGRCPAPCDPAPQW